MGCFNTCSSCEEQPVVEKFLQALDLFQYMLLLRGATEAVGGCHAGNEEFQYMLLLRGATQGGTMGGLREKVSIHAPLARSNRLKRA